MNLRRPMTLALLTASLATSAAFAQAPKKEAAKPAASTTAPATKMPNIVIIWGDDVGQSDISAYSHGLMGFRTPNIDRVAKEGMMFTDYYAEQSCTAGRASFITGQSGLRTGMTKVGLPGATLGLQKEDPTIAEMLKPLGYATGQFGKNHLGDRNEFLPTVHGFDEFYGNLYHLNAEEEPELPDYPKDPKFRAEFGPRGVMDCKASDKDDATVDPRFGKVGKQVCKDTGPLTKARMVGIDDDIAARAVDFIQRMNKAGKPAFVWVNFTHMHFRTHTKPESLGQSGRWQSPYHDTMIDHDKNVGQVLKVLDDLKIADNTFVMYSTDNGPHMNSWPDAAMTPFRNEKNSNWEGAYRVPAMVRWPGKIKPGTVSNEIVAHHDWMPTLLAIAGDDQVTDKLLKGTKVGTMTYKVFLDGFNLVPYLTGKVEKSPRESFLYVNDDQQLTGLRYDNFKFVFMEQRAPGTLRVWAEPFVSLRVPKIFNLRTDPYERADVTSNTYYDWLLDHAFQLVPAQAYVGQLHPDVQGLPAAAEGGVVQHGRGLREDEGIRRALRPAPDSVKHRAAPARVRPLSSPGYFFATPFRKIVSVDESSVVRAPSSRILIFAAGVNSPAPLSSASRTRRAMVRS